MIALRDTTTPNIIHYSSWKVDFNNPIWINSLVSSNSWKFAKTSQIINYETYMFIKKNLYIWSFRPYLLCIEGFTRLPDYYQKRIECGLKWWRRTELNFTNRVSCPLFSFMEYPVKNILGILFLFSVGHCVFADSLMTKIKFIEWKKQTINLICKPTESIKRGRLSSPRSSYS